MTLTTSNRSLAAASHLALSLMDEHGITTRGWTFRFDGAQSRMGLCSYRSKTISVSRHFAAEADDAQLRDVVLHEIAHALVGPGHHHDHVWKDRARQLGATPKSCGTNPYADRLMNEKIDAALAAVRSLGTIPGSGGLPQPVPYGRGFIPGDRVVHTRGSWAGRVFVIVEMRRTTYLAVNEFTRKAARVHPEHIRHHIEGENLNHAAVIYAAPSGEQLPTKAQQFETEPTAQILPWEAPIVREVPLPTHGVRRGDLATVNYPGSSHHGTVIRVTRVNTKTCSGTVVESRNLAKGLSIRVSHGILVRKDESAAPPTVTPTSANEHTAFRAGDVVQINGTPHHGTVLRLIRTNSKTHTGVVLSGGLLHAGQEVRVPHSFLVHAETAAVR